MAKKVEKTTVIELQQDYYSSRYVCRECGNEVEGSTMVPYYKYCPWCGKKVQDDSIQCSG